MIHNREKPSVEASERGPKPEGIEAVRKQLEELLTLIDDPKERRAILAEWENTVTSSQEAELQEDFGKGENLPGERAETGSENSEPEPTDGAKGAEGLSVPPEASEEGESPEDAHPEPAEEPTKPEMAGEEGGVDASTEAETTSPKGMSPEEQARHEERIHEVLEEKRKLFEHLHRAYKLDRLPPEELERIDYIAADTLLRAGNMYIHGKAHGEPTDYHCYAVEGNSEEVDMTQLLGEIQQKLSPELQNGIMPASVYDYQKELKELSPVNILPHPEDEDKVVIVMALSSGVQDAVGRRDFGGLFNITIDANSKFVELLTGEHNERDMISFLFAMVPILRDENAYNATKWMGVRSSLEVADFRTNTIVTHSTNEDQTKHVQYKNDNDFAKAIGAVDAQKGENLRTQGKKRTSRVDGAFDDGGDKRKHREGFYALVDKERFNIWEDGGEKEGKKGGIFGW